MELTLIMISPNSRHVLSVIPRSQVHPLELQICCTCHDRRQVYQNLLASQGFQAIRITKEELWATDMSQTAQAA